MTRHQVQTTARYGSRYASSDAVSSRACLVCTSPLTGSRARFCSAACKQLAYRKRLSVTPSVTSAPSDCSEFRYVRHAEVPRFIAEGWELLPALDGTHDGEYSALMRRRMEQD